MSIYNAIASHGRNAGSGYLAGAQNRYAIEQNQLNRERQDDATARNAFVQDRAFNANQAHRAQQSERQIKMDQQAYLKDTISLLSSLPVEQRQAAFQARLQQAPEAGLPAASPQEAQQAWESIQPMLAPLPADPNVAKNAEWERRNRIQQEQEIAAEARAKQDPKYLAGLKTAKLKVQDAQAKAAEAASTKGEIQSLAESLLKKNDDGEYELADGVSRVYGPVDRFVASFGAAYSAEADVDRLADLLTLGNMGKMKGVLSDADIKILKNAGSILGKKGLPESRVLEELKKIAGVFDGEAIDALVEKYAGQ